MWGTVTTAVSPTPPLSGFTVGVTAARRADELGAMLERRGATVQHAPALRIVPLADDTQLLAATRELMYTASSLLARRPMSLRAAHSKARPDIPEIVTREGSACQRFANGSLSSGK